LLTYGAATAASHTAPGQITVDEMVDRYALHLVNADTRVYVHVTSTERQYQDVLAAQEGAIPGAELHVSLSTPAAGAPALAALLTETIPFTIV